MARDPHSASLFSRVQRLPLSVKIRLLKPITWVDNVSTILQVVYLAVIFLSVKTFLTVYLSSCADNNGFVWDCLKTLNTKYDTKTNKKRKENDAVFFGALTFFLFIVTLLFARFSIFILNDLSSHWWQCQDLHQTVTVDKAAVALYPCSSGV